MYLEKEKKFMMNFEITKDYTVTKMKNDVKATAIEVIMEALAQHFDNVGMVRTGASSKTNEIGVIAGEALINGETVPVCFTVNASVKDPVERKTDKKTFPAFDFYKAKAEYEKYAEDKAIKEAEAAEKKAKRIEEDKKKREAE